MEGLYVNREREREREREMRCDEMVIECWEETAEFDGVLRG